jgi:DNA-binding transcriptional regulator PaaX
MERTLIYKDKAGNKLYEDLDRKLVILNAKGRLIKQTYMRPFIKQPNVKQAINKFYSGDSKMKVLTPMRILKPKKEVFINESIKNWNKNRR